MLKPLGLFAAAVVVASFAMPIGMAMAGPIAQAGPQFDTPGGPTNHISGAALLFYNWAGYAASGANGSVTKVTGSWVEPSATCTSSTSMAAFWVGIDGLNSSTVEQVGTIVECVGGVASYYSWWEMYPLNNIQLVGSVSPGDHITASVTHTHSGSYKLVLNDLTSSSGFTTTQSQSGTSQSSAECIVEAPSGANTASGLYLLADFGKLHFSNCAATISGTTSALGGFSTVDSLTMVHYWDASHDLATVSAMTANKAFTVVWHHPK